jgi:hypothetical protein
MSTTSEASEIRQELAALARRLDAVEFRLAQNGIDTVADLGLSAGLADIRQITGQLFPGKCELTSEFDPEYPDDRYVVVNVEAEGDPHSIVDRTCKWHELIRQLSGDLPGRLRLSVVPR